MYVKLEGDDQIDCDDPKRDVLVYTVTASDGDPDHDNSINVNQQDILLGYNDFCSFLDNHCNNRPERQCSCHGGPKRRNRRRQPA